MNPLAEAIKERVTMEDILCLYGFEVNRLGFMCCPFHKGDREPSLRIYSEDRCFHCFGCGAHGDVIDFVMGLFSLDFMESSEKIDRDFRLGLKDEKPITNEQRREMARKQRDMAANRKAEKLEREKVKQLYLDSLDELIALDKQRKELCPSSPSENPTSLYLDTLSKIAYAEYKLDCAESERNRMECLMHKSTK